MSAPLLFGFANLGLGVLFSKKELVECGHFIPSSGQSEGIEKQGKGLHVKVAK